MRLSTLVLVAGLLCPASGFAQDMLPAFVSGIATVPHGLKLGTG